MASNSLVFELEQIDRGLELRLRKTIVKAGHWPDPAPYIGQPAAAWEAAIEAIKTAGKTPIEVFGAGSRRERANLQANRVLIKRIGVDPGERGLGSRQYYEKKDSGDYRKLQTSETTDDIEYEVRFVCDDMKLDRIITTLVQAAFGNMVWMKGAQADGTDTENGFWLSRLGNAVDISGKDYIERLWRFQVKDVLIVPDTVVEEHIPAAKEIVFEMGTQGQSQSDPGIQVDLTLTIHPDGTEDVVSLDPA